MRFIQDDMAGIYFFPYSATNEPSWRLDNWWNLGDHGSGEFAPVVHRAGSPFWARARSPGPAGRYEQLASGEQDSQFVEFTALFTPSIRSANKVLFRLIETGCGRVTALVAQLPVSDKDMLVDSTVQFAASVPQPYVTAATV